MTDGFWRIKQFSPAAPSGFAVTEITMTMEPDETIAKPLYWTSEPAYLVFRHQDGREEFFPWASIVHAEYQPPTTNDTREKN